MVTSYQSAFCPPVGHLNTLHTRPTDRKENILPNDIYLYIAIHNVFCKYVSGESGRGFIFYIIRIIYKFSSVCVNRRQDL